MYYNTLNAEELLNLCTQNYIHKFIKIISYDLEGRPREQLEGICTGGSISIDGKSSVRRSCSLTFTTTNNQIYDAYWGLTSQFQLFVGLQDENIYSDIVWFPMGKFLISSFSYSYGLNTCNIAISGKDKMALLNGEMGGTFSTLSTNLSIKDIYDAHGNLINTEYLTFKEIIYNLLTIYGGIAEQDIIINGLDGYGKELLEYRGDEPMYLLKNTSNKISNQVILDANTLVYIGSTDAKKPVKISDSALINYETIGDILNNSIPTQVYTSPDGDEAYSIIKIEIGDTIGYKLINKIYGNDLVANLNETVVSILNKIVSYLANKYEYFFNIDGQFVFQPKAYLGPIGTEEIKLGLNSNLVFNTYNNNNNIDYTFLNISNMSNLSRKENILDIKNDFAIWGARNDIPIYLRYAINDKPVVYTTYNYEPTEAELAADPTLEPRPSMTYYSTPNPEKNCYDWRELIYQMAQDHSRYGHRDDYISQMLTNNNWIVNAGKTGYENYYTDILSFWRNIYDINPPALYNDINVARVNSTDAVLSDIFIDKIEILTNASISKVANRSNIYTVHNGQLQRWIDTVNFLTLKNEAKYGAKYDINNMYYFEGKERKKIIDSLQELQKNELFYVFDASKEAEPSGPYIPYYETLDTSIKENTYITLTKTSKNYLKLIDYFSVKTYELENLKDDTISSHFYLQQKKNSDMLKVNEFWLQIDKSTNDKVCIWKYDDTKIHLSHETINIINEAVKQFPTQLLYKCDGQDLTNYNSTNSIYIQAEREVNADCEFYYQVQSQGKISYEWLSSILLHDGVDPQKNPLYNKYNIYYYKSGSYIRSVDLIAVDKAKISIDTGKDGYSILILVMDKLDLPECNNLNEFYTLNNLEKLNIEILINNIEYNKLMPLYYQNDEYCSQLIADQLDLSGDQILQYYNKQKKENIKYYERYYDYFLKTYNTERRAYDYTNCWKKEIVQDFNKTTFWLDFLPYENYDLGQYAIPQIGCRPKSVQNNSVKGISFQDNLKVVFSTSSDELAEATAQDTGNEYTYILVNDKILSYFSRSTESLSCLDILNQLLVENLNMFNSINFNTLFMYFLQENDMIWLNSDKPHENGGYQISRININLSNNSSMQIQANKIIV